MKKFLPTILLIFFIKSYAFSNDKIKPIYEGNINANIKLIVYESLTCSHCGDFHRDIYPKLKKDFIDTGLAQFEFRNFPLDMGALNAAKIAHCKNDGNSNILHYLFKNQNKWIRGSTIEEVNGHLKNVLEDQNFNIDFDACINNKSVEDHILEDRITAVKKFKINSTPTLIINEKKFDNPFDY